MASQMLITDMQRERVFKNLNKNIGHYYDFHVQNDKLLLADILENIRSKYIEIYEHDPAHFLSAPGLVQQACLKKLK